MIRRLTARFAAGVVTLSFGTTTIAAWEADVHFGLTKWLALQVGFTLQEAEQIAQGNLGVDGSWVTGPIQTTMLSCQADPEGATVVHDHHFPSKIDVPRSPPDRVVEAGRVWRDGMLRTPTPGNLRRLGAYLHASQDTWSHAGEPDLPPVCSANHGWGHAKLRGGWACHLADLTFRWKEALDMAEETHRVLKAAAGKQQDWNTLMPRVLDFLRAANKFNKEEWFQAENKALSRLGQPFADTTFVHSLSLPDCAGPNQCYTYPLRRIADNWRRDFVGGLMSPDLPRAARDKLVEYLNALVSGALDTATRTVDTALADVALAAQLNVSGSCPGLAALLVPLTLTDVVAQASTKSAAGAYPVAVCEAALQSRLSGKPLSCKEALLLAEQAVRETSGLRGPSLKQLIELLGSIPPFEFRLFRSADERGVGAMARFVHRPADVMLLRLEPIKDVWTITMVNWIPRE